MYHEDIIPSGINQSYIYDYNYEVPRLIKGIQTENIWYLLGNQCGRDTHLFSTDFCLFAV